MQIVTVSADQALAGTPPATALDGSASTALDGVVVVQVSGDFDLYTGPALRRTLEGLLPSTTASAPDFGQGAGRPKSGDAAQEGSADVRAVVVDLSEVTFVDSYALGVLVHGHRLARPGGRAYALVATLEMLHMLFKVTGLTRVLPLHPDLMTALRSLHPASGDAGG